MRDPHKPLRELQELVRKPHREDVLTHEGLRKAQVRLRDPQLKNVLMKLLVRKVQLRDVLKKLGLRKAQKQKRKKN